VDELNSSEQMSYLDWTGDLMLRRDHVSKPDSIDRTRSRLRFGFRYYVDSWEISAIEEITSGSDPLLERMIRSDNETSNDIGVDEAYIRWRPSESLSLMAGKSKLPISFSSMLWDEDLRPIGLSASGDIEVGSFDRLSLTVGHFGGAHLYGDQTKISVVQAAWFWREGAPLSCSASLGYARFYGMDGLSREGLARSNTVLPGKSVVDAKLVDLQLGVNSNGERWPVHLGIDFVRNLGVRSQRDGVRASVSVGHAERRRGVEFGLAYQRVQRDAVVAAFSSDDWWFHSDVRGAMSWIAYGFGDHWSIRTSGFFEQRDRADRDVERVLVDLRANW
jgi:hypothetical protein